MTASSPDPAAIPSQKDLGRSRKILVVLAAVALIAIIAAIVGAGGSASKPGAGNTPQTNNEALPGTTAPGVPVAAPALKVTSCAADFVGQVEAKGTVRNTGPQRSNFAVVVIVKDTQGAQVDSTTAFVNNVAPNTSAQWDADDFQTDYTPGFVCRAVSATRTNSAG